MNATVNDHSVHEPAEALLSEADGQEEQEGETEENPSDTLQRDKGPPHWEYVSALGVGQRATTLRRWIGQRVTTLRGWVRQEVTALAKLAAPVILTLVLQQSILFVSLAYVGHISGKSLELDSAGLAISFVNVTSFSVAVGLSTAADTLCSQAYGFKNYKRVGVILQRGILILGLSMFPIWALWLSTESVLLLLHQSPCVARYTGVFVKIYCFALPPLFLYIMLQKYLQTQSIVWMFMLVTFLLNIISAVLHAILIFAGELGLTGAAISLVITNVMAPVILVVYMWTRKLHRLTWGGWSWESLREWGQFAKLAIPGVFMTCLPWWTAEATSFVSGAISDTELAVNSVGFQLINIMFMIPLGIGISVTIRVGKELGAGNPREAKRASFIAVAISLCVATFYAVTLQCTKNYIGQIFTKKEEVVQRVSLLMNVVTVYQFTDGIQVCCVQDKVAISGVLRGSGRQYVGAIANFICYDVIGLPLGVVLAFKARMGTIGLWTGLATGNIIQGISFFIIMLRTNWQKESQKAMNRSMTKTENGVELHQRNSNTENSNHDEFHNHLEDTNPALPPSTHRDEFHNHLEDTNPVLSPSTHPDSESTDVIESAKDSISVSKDTLLKEGDCHDTDEYLNTTGNCDQVPLTESLSEKTDDCLSATGSGSQQLNSDPCHFFLSAQNRSRLKLLLCRGSLFVVGIAVLIAGGILSRYHPDVTYGNYSECVDVSQNSSTINVSDLAL